MRPICLILLLLLLSGAFLPAAPFRIRQEERRSSQDRKPETDKDVFQSAESICRSWVPEENTGKTSVSLKIDAKSIAKDFEEMRKYIAEVKNIPDEVQKFLKYPYSAKPSSDKDYATEYLVAIWIEWRLTRAATLETAFKETSNLIKVRFKSVPDGAEVVIDGLSRGKTTYHLVLNKTRKYNIVIRKPQYTPSEKKGYSPTPEASDFEVELSKP